MDKRQQLLAAPEIWGPDPEIQRRRALFDAAGGRFCGVEFVKKDGTVRRMQVQPAKVSRDWDGQLPLDPRRQAALTRALRHPHLIPVWDVRRREPRTVNLATLRRLAVDGTVHRFAA